MTKASIDRLRPTIHVAVIIDAWFPGLNNQGMVGGGQIHVRELMRQLERDFGVSYTLFYPSRIDMFYRMLWSLVVTWVIHKRHKQKSFHLVHAHGFNAGLAGKLTAVMLRIPVVHTVHGGPLLDLNQRNLKTWLERVLLTRIKYNAQISVSQRFLANRNVNQPTVIPNGVDIKAFDAVKTTPHQRPTLVWVGRREESLKNFAQFEWLVKRLRRELPSIQATVAHGQLAGDDLVTAYKQAHLFISTSLAEGQPITLLEAWAARLPVVVTDVGDNRMMVEECDGGLVVQPNHNEQLVEACLALLLDKGKGEAMGSRGYEYVRQNMTWNVIAKQTMRVYRSLLEERTS